MQTSMGRHTLVPHILRTKLNELNGPKGPNKLTSFVHDVILSDVSNIASDLSQGSAIIENATLSGSCLGTAADCVLTRSKGLANAVV